CNPNCRSCYVYNQADTAWRSRPALMSDQIFSATVDRISRHVVQSGQAEALILFHGGEPMLVGKRRFDEMCHILHRRLGDLVDVQLAIQTNGVLIDEDWIALFRAHDVQLGVSLDGMAAANDRHRVDHKGRGSHAAVVRAMDRLAAADYRFGLLCVIPLGEDPVTTHRHFLDLGCSSLSYLLPTHDRAGIARLRQLHGPTPCADFLIPVFDDWFFNGSITFEVREFWSIGRLLMGGTSLVDSLGNLPLQFVAIETDGEMEGLDKLKACGDRVTHVGRNVLTDDFRAVADGNPFIAAAMHGLPLPRDCTGCVEAQTCAGGYLPHRFDADGGFDHSSVWCADLIKLFAHIRGRMDISPEETIARRAALRGLQGKAGPSAAVPMPVMA
ncbi:MAG: radical SAM protein, partial [Sphingobium sp.]